MTCSGATTADLTGTQLGVVPPQFAVRIAATAPKVAAALKEIHHRSPAARVVVVGYLTYWQHGGCYPADPYTAADADYPYHPNAAGMAAAARIIDRVVR